MRILFLTLIFCILNYTSYSQNTRSEVKEKITIVYDIIEDEPLYIKTSNFEKSKDLINAGISPITIVIYRFEKTGNNAPIYLVEETHYHTDRDLISRYSNEQNPKRKDFESYWLSQIATHTYGDVLKNSDGLYYTTQVYFNLE